MSLYDSVDAYEAAFGYRNLPAEVDLLVTWFARHHGGVPANVLELASGPGGHALEFARRGISATALDLSAAMCARVAAAGLPVDVVQADMTDFQLDRTFDLAILLLDSASLLLTDEAMSAFLGCVSRHLESGGLLIVDLSAPIGGGDRRRPDWTVDAGGRSVRTQWGLPGDSYDPATGVEMVHVRITATHPPEILVDEVVASRQWTAPQLRRLAPEGQMELPARYGSMSDDIKASDPHAVRDIPVFRRN